MRIIMFYLLSIVYMDRLVFGLLALLVNREYNFTVLLAKSFSCEVNLGETKPFILSDIITLFPVTRPLQLYGKVTIHTNPIIPSSPLVTLHQPCQNPTQHNTHPYHKTPIIPFSLPCLPSTIHQNLPPRLTTTEGNPPQPITHYDLVPIYTWLGKWFLLGIINSI